MDTPKAIHALFTRFLSGEEEAFGELYRTFYNRLLRYGHIVVDDPTIVEDTIQDLFIWLWENHPKATHIQDIEIYLFQSLKKNLWKKMGTTKRSQRLSNVLSFPPLQDTSQPSAEQSLIEGETQEFNRAWVRKQLQNLPQRQQEVLYLRYFEGLNYEEIATVVNVSNQVARNYASRALKMIRKVARLEELLTFLLFFLLS